MTLRPGESFFAAWEALGRELVEAVEPDPQRTLAALDPTRGSRYATAALQSECEAVLAAPAGTRNHTLNAAAFSIGQLVDAGHLELEPARAARADAALAAGLEPREVDATLRSGLSAGARKPRTALPEEKSWAESLTPFVPDTDTSGGPWDEPAPTPASAAATTESELIRSRLPRVDWRALWADDSEEDWIIEPILPARRLVALYSAPKVGKSLLMLELAVAICRGAPVLGTRIDRPRRVLYVDFENDPRGDVRERLQSMGYSPEQLDNLVYLSFPSMSGLDSEAGSRELVAAVQEYQCEVVMIDTVSRAVAGDENENDTWLRFYRHTGLKLKQLGVALMRLDHSGKDEAKGQRGGSAKVGDVDAVWRLSKVAGRDDLLELVCEQNRMPIAEKRLVLHRESGPLRHRVDGLGPLAIWDAKVDAAIALLDGAAAPLEASNRQAGSLLRSAGQRVSSAALAAALVRRRERAEMALGAFQHEPGTPSSEERSGEPLEHPGTPPVPGPEIGLEQGPEALQGTSCNTSPEGKDPALRVLPPLKGGTRRAAPPADVPSLGLGT